MTDIWDELNLDRWTWELPRDTPGPYVAEHIPKPLIMDWVKTWKPIINDALEKAEKFDRYNLHKISLEENGVWGAINKLDTKLEAVRNYCENTLGATEEFPNWMKPVRDEMEHILKILEGETLQSIGESE